MEINNPEQMLPDSEVIEEWKEVLDNFITFIYPKVFRGKGFTVAEAFSVWQLNMMRGDLVRIEELLEEKEIL